MGNSKLLKANVTRHFICKDLVVEDYITNAEKMVDNFNILKGKLERYSKIPDHGFASMDDVAALIMISEIIKNEKVWLEMSFDCLDRFIKYAKGEC